MAPVHLDPKFYGSDADQRPWSRTTWRSWLREGAEPLLFRVGVHRLTVAPVEMAAPPVQEKLTGSITG